MSQILPPDLLGLKKSLKSGTETPDQHDQSRNSCSSTPNLRKSLKSGTNTPDQHDQSRNSYSSTPNLRESPETIPDLLYPKITHQDSSPVTHGLSKSARFSLGGPGSIDDSLLDVDQNPCSSTVKVSSYREKLISEVLSWDYCPSEDSVRMMLHFEKEEGTRPLSIPSDETLDRELLKSEAYAVRKSTIFSDDGFRVYHSQRLHEHNRLKCSRWYISIYICRGST